MKFYENIKLLTSSSCKSWGAVSLAVFLLEQTNCCIHLASCVSCLRVKNVHKQYWAYFLSLVSTRRRPALEMNQVFYGTMSGLHQSVIVCRVLTFQATWSCTSWPRHSPNCPVSSWCHWWVCQLSASCQSVSSCPSASVQPQELNIRGQWLLPCVSWLQNCTKCCFLLVCMDMVRFATRKDGGSKIGGVFLSPELTSVCFKKFVLKDTFLLGRVN